MIKVYTAVVGNKETPRTDIECFRGLGKFINPVMEAKIYKVLPHKFIDADISVWLDGNIFLKVDPEVLVNDWLGNADVALVKHPIRDCIYNEAEAAKLRRPNASEDIEMQVKNYRRLSIPEHIGLNECGVLIRRNTKLVNSFNEAWWAEICRWSERDQLSFPVVLREFNNLKVNVVNEKIRDCKYLKYEPHF